MIIDHNGDQFFNPIFKTDQNTSYQTSFKSQTNGRQIKASII